MTLASTFAARSNKSNSRSLQLDNCLGGFPRTAWNTASITTARPTADAELLGLPLLLQGLAAVADVV
jgi:hypothetical protein